MTGNKEIIGALNDSLTAELTAINMYYVHYKMQENWGFNKLAEHAKDETMGEMKHADQLIERILYLDGVPNMQKYDKILIGDSCEKQLKDQYTVETKHVKELQQQIKLCISKNDFGTKEILYDILTETEEACDWLETQFQRIKDVGIQNYLTEHMHG